MSTNFYVAMLSFAVTTAVVLLLGRRRAHQPSAGRQSYLALRLPASFTPRTLALAALVAGTCILLNIRFG